MSKTKTTRWEEKREAILDAATRVLNRTGLSGFRLAEVAAEIGLKRPSIVYYFANAEELAQAVYEGALDQLERHVSSAAQQSSISARIDKLFELELAHHAAERTGGAIRRPQLGEVRSLSGERRRALGKRYFALLEKVAVMLGANADDPITIRRLGPAHILMETVFWLPAWIDEYEPWAFKRVRDNLVGTLLRGVSDRAVKATIIGEPVRVETDSIGQDDYLRAATRLICDMGSGGAAIDRISAQLGVTKGSFYHHVAQKDGLIEACFAQSQQRLSQIQQSASERDIGPDARLASVIGTVAAIQMERRFPLLRTSALPALSAEARAQIITQSKRNFRWFASEIAHGIALGTLRAPDPHVAAQVIGVAINAVYDLRRLYSGGQDDCDVEAFTRMLMQGILTRYP